VASGGRRRSLPLKRIALSLLDLLRSAEPHRLKTLRLAGLLRWLFYDTARVVTPVVRHGGLRHDRENAPLPPETSRASARRDRQGL